MVVDITTSQNKNMFKGDNRIFTITVKDASGVAVDITGGAMVFTMKKHENDPTGLIVKDSAVGIAEVEFTNPTNGIADIKLLPADTSGLPAITYVYDVQFTTSLGSVHTLLKSKLTLFEDVTS